MGKRMDEAVARFLEIRQRNLLGGGETHIQRQHDRGKLTARERIDLLADSGTFSELGSTVGSTGKRLDGRVTEAPCDGAVVGSAEVNGRLVMIYASDFTVLGGSTAMQHLFKFAQSLEMAARWGIPMVNLLDSSGGRLGHIDQVSAGIEWHFRIQSKYSGVIPQVTVLMGPCIAGGAYLPTLCDFLIMSRVSGFMWLGGPRQTAAATSEQIDENIGGADYHMQLSGSCDLVGDDDEESIALCRKLLRYLPQSWREQVPPWDGGGDAERLADDPAGLVPDELEQSYDMHEVIAALVDDGDYLEIKDAYAPSLITCFARFAGRVAGVVASNPAAGGSVLEVDCCDKYYRFLQVLDAYGVPLVNLVDTPPRVPGESEEARGLLRHIGKLADVYATSTIPKISVVLREAWADAGAMVMGVPKTTGSDLVYAWPIARFGIEASRLDYREVYGRGIDEDAAEAYLERSRGALDVFDAAYAWTAQVVDEIILPSDTRRKIIEALALTASKHEELPRRAKSHGSPPT